MGVQREWQCKGEGRRERAAQPGQRMPHRDRARGRKRPGRGGAWRGGPARDATRHAARGTARGTARGKTRGDVGRSLAARYPPLRWKTVRPESSVRNMSSLSLGWEVEAFSKQSVAVKSTSPASAEPFNKRCVAANSGSCSRSRHRCTHAPWGARVCRHGNETKKTVQSHVRCTPTGRACRQDNNAPDGAHVLKATETLPTRIAAGHTKNFERGMCWCCCVCAHCCRAHKQYPTACSGVAARVLAGGPCRRCPRPRRSNTPARREPRVQ